MLAKIGILIFALSVLSGCTNMKPTDFSGTKPVLRIEEYFQGQTLLVGAESPIPDFLVERTEIL